MTVYERLLNVQRDLKAPKGQRNSFGNYNYRSAEDIIEAVKPLLHKNGLVMTIDDDVIMLQTLDATYEKVDKIDKEGNPIKTEHKTDMSRVYIKATVRVFDVENPSDLIQTSALAREALDKKGMDESQITGAASSYARKYALNGMFAIDDTKDADTETHTVATGRDKVYNRVRCINYIKDMEPNKREALFAKYNKETGKKVTDPKYMTNDFMERFWAAIKW